MANIEIEVIRLLLKWGALVIVFIVFALICFWGAIGFPIKL